MGPIALPKYRLKLADQSSMEPYRHIYALPIKVQGLSFIIECIVLDLHEDRTTYHFLLGTTWLDNAEVIQD